MNALNHQTFEAMAVSIWSLTCLIMAILLFGSPHIRSPQDIDVRQDMYDRFPRISWVQRLLTIWTGKAHTGQKPLWRKGWKTHLIGTIAFILAGLVIQSSVISFAWQDPTLAILLLPLTISVWLLGASMLVGGARNSLTSIIHQSVHGKFTGKEKIDLWIGHMFGSILLFQDYHAYRIEHCGIHHKLRYLATSADPDAIFMCELGFRSDMTRREAWNHLISLIISPQFHTLFLKHRLRSNLSAPETPKYRRYFASLSLITPFAACVMAMVFFNNLLPFILWVTCWFVPLVIGYQISALLQFASEHYWSLAENVRDLTQLNSKKGALARLTNGRFMADPLPQPGLKGISLVESWTWWVIRMITVNTICRLAIMTDDLCSHDWHHRHQTSENWGNAVYERQADLDAGCPDWPENYTNIYGLGRAIDAVFGNLSLHKSVALKGDFSPLLSM